MLYFLKSNRGKRFRLMVALLTMSCLLLGMLPVTSFGETISNADANPDTIRYDFLNAFSEGGNLEALGDLAEAPATTLNPVYGAAISATSIGESRSFRFDVPETGTYSIAFQGYLYFKAGIGELSIDGQSIGTYDFYDPGSTFGPTVSMGTMELTEGEHTLTFTATGRNPSAETGPNYSLYATALLLTPGDEEAIVQLTAEPNQSQISVHETAQMRVKAVMSDGSDVTNPEYTYTSSDETVATVNASGHITGVSEGTAIITTTVTAEQGTASQNSLITVIERADRDPIVYHFADAFAGSGPFFALGELSEPAATSLNSVYGAAISARSIGESRSFQFTVPETGYYLISFKGYLYFSAGIGEISINGEPIGTYDFYDPGSRFGPTERLKTLELTEGEHIVTFEAIGRNPSATQDDNYSMYASEFIMTPMPGAAELQLSAQPTKNLLLVNESTQMHAAASMSDGTAVTGQEITYESDDESVVTISDDGLITAVGAGTAVITTTVTSNQGTATVTSAITVSDEQLSEVNVSMKPEDLFVGGMAKLVLEGVLTDGTSVDLTNVPTVYTVDDPSVVSVSDNGTVTGLSIGQTLVRANVTFNGVRIEGVYLVDVTPKSLTSLDLLPDEQELTVSQYADLSVKGFFDDGSEADLTLAKIEFSSLNEHVVEIGTDGRYHGLEVGESEISATVTLGDSTVTESTYVSVTELTNAKTRSTIYTPEKLANARENAKQYAWAKSVRDSAASNGDHFVELGYDFLWNLVPPQSLPRSYGVNQVLGSPVTGKEIDRYGNYPYTADPVSEPWKITDPSSGYKFPTNDFGAYYESGLNERGLFDPDLADRSLLVNTLYPEKGPTWGVDDGYGWVDENGNYYTFISYYVHWHLWYGEGMIQTAIQSLRDAYIYTGDIKYARAGIVLLDRIADVYPSLDASEFDTDIYLQSAQGTGTGKAVGSVWETSLVEDFVSAYDAFYPVMDDPEVIAFLSEKGREYKLSWKDSGTGLRRNVEEGIIRQVYPGVKQSQIRGNVGMHQSALAMAAVVYDTFPDTKEWLDFNNQAGGRMANPWRVTGGNLLASLVNDVDRDGHGNESAPGYNRLWLNNYLQVADVLYGYDKYPQADLYENVKFQKMFHAFYPLFLSENYTPTIGDSGSTGNPGATGLDMAQMIKAFEVYGDPIFAQMAYFLNNHSVEGIHSDIFTANPEQVAEQIEAVIDEEGMLNLPSMNLTGYGFAALRDGQNDKRDYGIRYGFPRLEVTQASTEYNTYDSSGTVQLEANSAGQRIGFRFEVAESEEYHVMLKPFRAPSYGIYRVFIDDEFVKEIDFFGSNRELELLNIMNLDAGAHTISFENNGRNDSATNFKMGVTQLLLLTPEEAALVEQQQNTLRDVWLYHGRTSGHGHRDTLNLGLHAYGLDLAPDLGYPEFADNVDMHRHQWVNNTISHNTVVVNKRKQQSQYVGQPMHYDDTEQVKLIDVAAPKPYPDTEEYRRTTAMIKVDDERSYTVDFFRVRGGDDHHFSFHSAEGGVTTEGLSMVTQPTGTYAGPDIEFGVRADDVEGAGYMGSGFHWLKDVERDDNPSDLFSVDWNVKDTWNIYGEGAHAETDVHLRLTMLGQVDSVALANGVPPRNKGGNPSEIRYLIAHRTGENLDSLFSSVIEPYKGDRYVKSITEAEITTEDGTVIDPTVDNNIRAVRVELMNGRTDTIIYSANSEKTYLIDGKIVFSGFFGVYSEQNGELVYSYVNDGTVMGAVDAADDRPIHAAALTGTVVDFTRELSTENDIIVSMNMQGLSPEQLTGRMVYVQNDGERNAVYLIQHATEMEEGKYRLHIGDTTLIRQYVNVNDFDQGFVYDIASGASLKIPLSYEHVVEAPIPSVESIQRLVENLEDDGAFSNDQAVRALTMHLTAVHVFEQQEDAGKMIQHMSGFNMLLEHQKREGWITEEAYNELVMKTDELIEYWRG